MFNKTKPFYGKDSKLSTDLTGDVTLHELNHYTDFIKNKSPHADANSNLFY
jgi:hypothetical protein|nr:MAG TPA: hypothetical protein [Caudoviricetes sp.]